MSERRRLDIGVASYRNPKKLRKTLQSIEAMSHTDWRCFIVHNRSEDDEGLAALSIIGGAVGMNSRFRYEVQENSGYAGAVNRIVELAETPYVAYLDNDVEILTPGWDEKLCSLLDRAPEAAQAFPGEGHYGFLNEGQLHPDGTRHNRYHECLWNAGYAWVLRKESGKELPSGYPCRVPCMRLPCLIDPSLGHHEEVDLMIRLRLAGYRIACDPSVNIVHHASSTNSPESAKRIHAGVVRWMNKWNRYFCGDVLTYPNPDPDSGEGYDPRSLRYTDWPPCALYLERWTLAQFQGWNAEPAVIQTSAGPMDAIRILKPTGCYKGRAI